MGKHNDLLLYMFAVAPHTGCVDVNWTFINGETEQIVAPHTGCVDVNCQGCAAPHEKNVAPHTGCVDVNCVMTYEFVNDIVENVKE